MSLSIEIRDPRLSGGRMAVRAGTADKRERDARREILRQLLDTERGRVIVQRLRDRRVSIDQVVSAVRSFDLAGVEPLPDEPESKAPQVMLGATIDKWLTYLEGADRSPETLLTYTSFARGLEQAMGVVRGPDGAITHDVAVSSITRQQGEDWLVGRKESTGAAWAPGTQRVAHAVPSQVWDRAIAEEEEIAAKYKIEPRITANFWRKQGSRKGVRGARIRKTRVEYLQRGEAARLLRAIKGTQYAAWIACGLYAGLRGGEASNLRRGADLDMVAGVIRVQGRKGQYEWRTKTERSERTIPLHPKLARWFRLHERLGFAGEVYVFRQPGKDRPISRSAWKVWTRTAYEAGGIAYGRRKDALVHHSLRHTFASWLTSANVHPTKIAALMGDSVEMVISTYAHLVPGDLHEALREI